MSACSLTADLLSKCTWNVPFTNVWVQEIVDTAVATHPVTVFPKDLSFKGSLLIMTLCLNFLGVNLQL